MSSGVVRTVLLVCPGYWRPVEKLRAALSECFKVWTVDTDAEAELLLHERAFDVVVVHHGLELGGLAMLSFASVVRPSATLAWLVAKPARVKDVLQDLGPFAAILDEDADPETLVREVVEAVAEQRRGTTAASPCDDDADDKPD